MRTIYRWKRGSGAAAPSLRACFSAHSSAAFVVEVCRQTRPLFYLLFPPTTLPSFLFSLFLTSSLSRPFSLFQPPRFFFFFHSRFFYSIHTCLFFLDIFFSVAFSTFLSLLCTSCSSEDQGNSRGLEIILYCSWLGEKLHCHRERKIVSCLCCVCDR